MLNLCAKRKKKKKKKMTDQKGRVPCEARLCHTWEHATCAFLQVTDPGCLIGLWLQKGLLRHTLISQVGPVTREHVSVPEGPSHPGPPCPASCRALQLQAAAGGAHCVPEVSGLLDLGRRLARQRQCNDPDGFAVNYDPRSFWICSLW